MDATIRAKFYQAEIAVDAQPGLFDCLQRLWAHPQRQGYEEVFRGVRVRLERFEDDAAIAGQGFVDGELVRQQTDNILPIAVEGEPLEGRDHPLGHRCAFRYHPETQVLLLERRPSGVTHVMLTYLIRRRLAGHSGFHFAPLMTEEGMERLRGGTPRRIQFRVANPARMAALEGDDESELERDLARLANRFNGLSIEVTVGFPRGNREGALSMQSIQRLIPWATRNRQSVEKFQVKVSEEGHPIDIFSDQMKVEDELVLDSVNVEANYETRRALLRLSFDNYMGEIRRLYALP